MFNKCYIIFCKYIKYYNNIYDKKIKKNVW